MDSCSLASTRGLIVDEARRPVRCAIYTRKSTEEGLEQNFNSLHAQRESAEAYIASQRQAGWVALEEHYDDGGFSGANVERPALRRLMAEIEAGRIDCVVVYKVDRLSRSLLDFARLISVFDQRGVSFVSVTQDFNTTTSLGRLTLNILLSFAQFEREIISERTRDKLGAARRKGKWIGGIPVLGYDVDPRGQRLIVNPAEAERVREIFGIADQTGSLAATLQKINVRGFTTKDWTSRKGTHHKGRPFPQNILRALLGNVLYKGSICHKGTLYPGEQPALVEEQLWERVNERLLHNGRHLAGRAHAKQMALLAGLLFCGQCGALLKQTFTRQRANRYYVCDCAQVPVAATDLESAVVRELEPMLGDRPDEVLIRQKVKRATYDSRTRQVVVDLEDGTQFQFHLAAPNGQGVRGGSRPREGRVPRVSRLMALAIKFEKLVREHRLRDYAEIARLGEASRARLSQIVSLINLAPAIQEALLFLPKTVTGHDRITEKQMRKIAQVIDWERQQVLFHELRSV
jgi:DNA invertase Pin-like site-specific DNA recombinase